MSDEQRTAVARAIWNIRREAEDRCDMELEDMGRDHPVWDEADAVLASLPDSAGEAGPWSEKTALEKAPSIIMQLEVAAERFTRYSHDTIDGLLQEAADALRALAAPHPVGRALTRDEDEQYVLERGADLLEGYADWIKRTVMSAQIEEHPYLPEIEGTAEDLRALAASPAPLAELRRLAGCCPELNLSNYGPDDVGELNAWAIEVAQCIDGFSAPAPAVKGYHPGVSGEPTSGERDL